MPAPETVSSALHITLFGPMQVLVHAQRLPHLRSRKALWLLTLLILRHDRPVEREWLAGTLWPDVNQSQAFANLRPALSELRRALGEEGARLQSPSRHTLLLDLAGAEVDVLAFDRAIESRKLDALEQAVSLYRGTLLEGCAEEWVFQEREAREQDCLRALQTLADNTLTLGDYGAAIGYYQRAVSLDPWWDTARRGLMEALSKGGDRNAALQVYREFAALLRNNTGALPDEETSALYTRLRAEARQRGSGHAVVTVEKTAVPVVTGYLPHPLTELVGREDERLEVGSRLRRSRLVTLTGLGGIGKTRLAMEVARQVVTEYTDGVWLVALDSLTESRRVLQQIASVLGLKEEAGRPLLESLTSHLSKKRLLLVLDNCEHLLEASAQIAGHLLRECAEVRILATSREALGITGETAWAVPSLAVPEPEHLPQGRATLLRVLMGYESVQLFVERAQAAHKSFLLTGGNALIVAEICSRLEGIPLALEFAAARVKAMAVEQIAARLNDHLSLLMGGNRMALSRQQTLRATLDWSYVLLSEAERLLLRRLAVFAAGWTLEAAEQVCAGEGIETGQILDLLTSLVDKSLVAFEEREPEGGGRYRLLEMVRQYAAEKLQTSGERGQVEARHRNWVLSLAEAAESQLKGVEQERWLRRLDREHANLRVALSGIGVEAEESLRIAGALYPFWYIRGYWSEGREHLGRALERPQAQSVTEARAKALNGAGALAYSQGDYASARTLHEESLSLHRRSGDKGGIAGALNSLGKVAYDQGDYALAWALHEESLSLRRDLGEKQGIAWTLNSLANIAHPQGEYATAQALYEESLGLFRELGDRQGVARSLSCLGYVALDQGEHAKARAQFEESLSLFEELGDRGGIAWACDCLGYVAYDQGDYIAARTLLERGLSLFQELGDRRGVAWSLNSLGNVVHLLGEYSAAHTLHTESLHIRRELGDRQGIAWSLICLGNLAYDQGDYVAARELHTESMTLFQELGDRKGVVENLAGLASILLAQGAIRQAVHLWGAVHVLRERLGAPLSPNQRAKYAQQIRQARMALSEDTFAAAWEEGHALNLEESIALVFGQETGSDLHGARGTAPG